MLLRGQAGGGQNRDPRQVVNDLKNSFRVEVVLPLRVSASVCPDVLYFLYC